MLNINNKNITEIRIGEKIITSIYHGVKLIWSSPILISDEISKGTINLKEEKIV